MGRESQTSQRHAGGGSEPESVRRLVLCAGLKSSGSTWLYNAVIKILHDSGSPVRDGPARKRRTRLLPFYAESIEQFPSAAATAETLIVKTHIPSPSLQFLASFVGATTFVTIREPRDAIASLMQRFGHDFRACLREVSAGASRLIDLSRSNRSVVLRYEDRFFDRRETVARVATLLGVRLPAATLLEIYNSLRPECVTQYIRVLQKAGAFGRRAAPDSFDSRTHWHPGHIGDRKIGKFPEILSAKMQQTVLQAMREYCIVFGYPYRTTPDGKKGRTTSGPTRQWRPAGGSPKLRPGTSNRGR